MDSHSFQTTASESPAPVPAVTAVPIQKIDSVSKPGVQSNEGSATKPESVATDVALKPEEKKEENATQRFGALARREQQHVREKQQIAVERQRLAADQASFNSIKTKNTEEEELWRNNPLEALKRHGWDYDKLTQLQLNENRPTPDMVAKATVKEEISAYEKRMQEERQKELEKFKEEEKKHFEATLKEFREEVQNFIKAPEQQDTCELINLHDANEIVLATIEEHFQNTKKAGKPEVMSIKQACDLVENYLEEQVTKSINTRKWTKKANPEPSPNGVKSGEAKPSPQSVPPRTISNNLTSSAQNIRPLSREERIKRALSIKVSS
jgi:hypothetical protein